MTQQQAALEDVYRRKRHALIRWTMVKFRFTKEQAEDCLHDVMIREWRNPPRRVCVTPLFTALFRRAMQVKEADQNRVTASDEWAYSGFAVARDCACGRPIVDGSKGGKGLGLCNACYVKHRRAERKKAA